MRVVEIFGNLVTIDFCASECKLLAEVLPGCDLGADREQDVVQLETMGSALDLAGREADRLFSERPSQRADKT